MCATGGKRMPNVRTRSQADVSVRRISGVAELANELVQLGDLKTRLAIMGARQFEQREAVLVGGKCAAVDLVQVDNTACDNEEADRDLRRILGYDNSTWLRR